MSDEALCDLPLPSGWPRSIKSAVLHVVSLAHLAIVTAHGWAADSINPRARRAAQADRLNGEVALLTEELRIKDARLRKVDPRRRPYYPAAERMAILALRAARGWSLARTARAFLVEPETVAAWARRIDEPGASSLVQLREPVNKFPDFVRHIVQRLKALRPTLGKARIAQTLARCGLHLCATTVGRMLQARAPAPRPAVAIHPPVRPVGADRVVAATHPHHVWHVDLTVVATGGFWTAWLPRSLPQVWPFCWWLSVIVDHYSRRVVGVGVFRKQPDGRQVRQFLAETIRDAAAKPKHIICDKGPQFWCKPFKRWCRRRDIRPRFGAVGQHGSLAVIERFIRTFKDEGLRRILIPISRRKMREEIGLFATWYNTRRPHSWLGGRTPEERCRRIPAACRRPRLEPRPHWPRGSPCAAPPAKVHGKPGARLELVVAFHQGRRHLPIVALRRTA